MAKSNRAPNVTNILKKLDSDQKLTAAEKDAIVAYSKKGGKAKELWVGTNEALAFLEVSKQTLYEWRKADGFPEPKKEGRKNIWDVVAIRDWINSKGLGTGANKPENDREALLCDKLRKEIELLAIKIEKERGVLIDRDEADRILAKVAIAGRSLLYQLLETEFPMEGEGLSVPELRELGRSYADRICLAMKKEIDEWAPAK